MKYCPYCAFQLTKPSNVCPNCKKILDTGVLSEIYFSEEGSEVNKKLLRQKWFKEHSYIIFPILTLIIGFFVGGIIIYGYTQLQFKGERSGYQNTIAELKTTIANKDSSVANSNEEFQKELNLKNDIITALSEQKVILSRVINFTRRFSNNSIITPNSEEEADYFKRNVLYLNNQFEKQQEKLDETGFASDESYNLLTIPEILEN
jgi:hypothetical protein